MNNGKYGIKLEFYAALAFIFAIFGQVTLCALLLGFVIVLEREEWVVRQVIQAFCLCLFASLFSVVNAVFSIFTWIPFLGNIFSWVISGVAGIFTLGIIVFAIIALANVMKGKDANVPLAVKFSNWAYGVVEDKVYNTPPTGN